MYNRCVLQRSERSCRIHVGGCAVKKQRGELLSAQARRPDHVGDIRDGFANSGAARAGRNRRAKVDAEGRPCQRCNYYPEDVGDGSHSPPADTAYCNTGSTYNDCDDLSDTLYIHVFRNSYSSDDCATFELEITNG